MKFLLPALIAITGVAAIAATAGAASCVSTGFTPWGNIARCPAPNQNLGASQGFGVLGLPSRILQVQLSNQVGNISATAQGISQTGKTIAGCKVFANPGQTKTTTAGACNGGNTHVVAVVFN